MRIGINFFRFKDRQTAAGRDIRLYLAGRYEGNENIYLKFKKTITAKMRVMRLIE